ncbi:sensor domain-containing diguanylate cyclase [Herbaspirillum sp.]|uniref:sensor domain-containing diguanylate cyclase n=1 Tax=Herbaspirillum sp. TaxID=1890675 RepID=UPI001B059D75|nr:sensor domain-containing diguanylate cyclase [Herbaspirillum sp.]MBO9535564.1 sensor domain-containing diguanylate cyclase [Herbaspirillum sp.]
MNTRQKYRTSTYVLCLVIIICTALLWIEIWNAWQARKTQLKETYAAVNNVSYALAQHANQTFKEADIVLAGVSERIRYDGLGPAALDRLHLMFASAVQNLPALDGIFVYNETGEQLVTSRQALQAQFNNADREYFQYHRDHPDFMPHIGPPVFSRGTKKWIFTISRRIDKADGSFGGVVLATLDVASFQKFYDQFEIGSEGAILLGLMNGTALYRRPFTEDAIGRDLSNTQIYRTLISQKNASIVTIKSSVDGVVRFNSFRRVDDYPLFVVAAMSKDEALAEWVGDTLMRGIFIFTGIILVLLFGNRLIFNINRRELAEQKVLDAKKKQEELNRILSQLAMQDGLTGLANRRHFDQSLATEMNRARREDTCMSLLMIDVDFFKRYNDRYGHQCGDDCLKKVAGTLQACLQRPGDIAARYGGEEFAVILPECDTEGAKNLAARICQSVRDLHLEHEDSPGKVVTVSIGVATVCSPLPTADANELLRAADAALYESKTGGRDRFTVFATSPGQHLGGQQEVENFVR